MNWFMSRSMNRSIWFIWTDRVEDGEALHDLHSLVVGELGETAGDCSERGVEIRHGASAGREEPTCGKASALPPPDPDA